MAFLLSLLEEYSFREEREDDRIWNPSSTVGFSVFL